MNYFQTIAKNILLAFIYVTLGFALGREMTLRKIQSASISNPGQKQEAAVKAENKIIIYYLHATFRCVTCNTIEKMTGELLNSQFNKALKNGSIEWIQADFQKDDALAKKYEVISSCVVIVQIRDGKETGYKRLDEVWTLMNDPAAFNNYVGDAITRFLDTKKPEAYQ